MKLKYLIDVNHNFFGFRLALAGLAVMLLGFIVAAIPSTSETPFFLGLIVGGMGLCIGAIGLAVHVAKSLSALKRRD